MENIGHNIVPDTHSPGTPEPNESGAVHRQDSGTAPLDTKLQLSILGTPYATVASSQASTNCQCREIDERQYVKRAFEFVTGTIHLIPEPLHSKLWLEAYEEYKATVRGTKPCNYDFWRQRTGLTPAELLALSA